MYETNVSPKLEKLCEKLEREIAKDEPTIDLKKEKQNMDFDKAIIFVGIIMILVTSF